MSNQLKLEVEKLLNMAGVKINGKSDSDIKVNDDLFYRRALAEGSIGVGESYMDGMWDCKSLDVLFDKLLSARLDSAVSKRPSLILAGLKARMFNPQTKKRASKSIESHYDIGNDLYKLMLDKRMIYSCGYWKNAKTLDQSQEAKLDLICKKVGLKKGQKILDIGCGWGGFAKFAAERYGVKVVGITISKEQAALARENCKGLDVEIRLQDYRDLDEKFDHIISIGMFEHVGVRNYKTYMKMVNKNLKDGGLFLLHTIGASKSGTVTDPWIHKYVFPDSLLPSPSQISSAADGLFVLEDWHNFGEDYDKTLMAWHSNFEKNWPKLKDKYDERFKRMWDFYLLSCAGSFRCGKNRLWQIVFSKSPVKGGYKIVR